MKTLKKGYDIKFHSPGTVDEEICCVCSTKMDVERNVQGATSYASAISGHTSIHDQFICPNAGKNWHNQAIALMRLAEETPSAAIERIIRDELAEVLRNKKATKKVQMLF